MCKKNIEIMERFTAATGGRYCTAPSRAWRAHSNPGCARHARLPDVVVSSLLPRHVRRPSAVLTWYVGGRLAPILARAFQPGLRTVRAFQPDVVVSSLLKMQAKAEATAAQAERDQATKAASQAREESACLTGQLDTLKEQSAALLARIHIQHPASPDWNQD